ncbi:hypothetical protein HXX25_08595 [Hyphobacterium sp. CCMP332]|jgi:Na+/H+-dicarboxylate symporter|uniref:DUF6460 domain-containing protein n=1 Tax=Hyphobacterium sp. CCMP332 TaxID=2749086 RepID=UPI001650B7F8|nr:DUF6460 domain-containing protein [Hyphobacterium sp. CCMP332]QNL19368.1 hypothetical protein HXX25_08595 [Hyphobacterium sp. CCMP332]
MSETENQPAHATTPPERKSRIQRLLSVTPGDILRVALISVIVGIVLAAFNINPGDLWQDFFGTLAEVWGEAFETVTRLARGSVQYLVLGAVLVVPIWLVVHIIRSLGKRSP